MDRWDKKRHDQEKHRFIQRRIQQAPLWTQFTLIFAISWGAAWLCSWFLLHFFAPHHAWASNLPVRYAISFLFAYACFFLAVHVWIDFVKYEPTQQHITSSDWANALNFPGDAEGCLIAVVLAIVGFIISGLFLWTGGAPMLLEAAFEAAFAGVVVSRPLSGNIILGNWKLRLLKNTWKRALGSLLVLIAVAAWLQQQAPQANTLTQAIRAIFHHNPTTQSFSRHL